MKKIIVYGLAFFAALSFFACKDDSKNQKKSLQEIDLSAQTQQIYEQQSQEIKSNSNVPKSPKIDFTFVNQEIKNSAFHTDAHAQFLNDPLKFVPLPDQGIKEGETAVVGSDVCVLYPKEAFRFKDDGTAEIDESIYDKNAGSPIPFASIVQITGNRLENGAEGQNPYANKMFDFQSNWNWFYPVEWNGQSGWVFGADLYGLNDSLESNKISAELYRTNGKYENFYPIAGYSALSENIAQCLEENRLAFQRVQPKTPTTDDMIDEYNRLDHYNRLPIFITTDLAAHAQHVIFDRMLQFTEETYFYPRMEALTKNFIAKLKERSDAPEEIREKAIQYFQVPELIIKTAPEKVKSDSWYDPIKYEAKSAEFIENALAEYPESVQTDYKNVLAASGRSDTAIFGVEEDFSQYKPRGHYTKNPVLEAYFRAEMWYGRIHFMIARSDLDSRTQEKTLEMEPVALLIVDTVQKNPELYEEWVALFDPITKLIGLSDDLSIREILPLWKAEKVEDFSAWSGDKEKIIAFMKLCHEKLRPPAISGNSVFTGLSESGEDGTSRNPPMGWRLFGQRFTYDSYIHSLVSPPKLMSRDIVRGLDVMKVFGSKTAELLLADSDYQTMVGLKDTLDSLQAAFDSFGSDFWNQTYYNQVLYQVKTLANFEQGAGFYFTESPAWNIKAMLSSHGTWAELRHDTILYVKQNAVERAGDGDFEPTFRTKPLPRPIHYVEPNIPFWQASLNSVNALMNVLNEFYMLDDESKYTLNEMIYTYEQILRICKKEAENKPITENENIWITTIASRFDKLIFVHTPNHDIIEDKDQLKMACIADVFSNYELGVCLEVGVGNPIRIYVPLNDSQGGKRIALGYCFSYAEFPHDVNDRMTDEQWKKIVYNQDYTSYMPEWESNSLLDYAQYEW